ncbi:MAG: GntR family transcriptional regulator [Clostridia bacterium]|nr:GntR family transcriptional regulator [Clostridia bacterium]
MRKLQSESSNPLYQQLMHRILEDIEKGDYPVGSRIPPEHELEQTYQVSRVTVRRALAELTENGLLERKQGKGTFVSIPRGRQDQRNVHSFHDACRESGAVPGTKVLSVRAVAASPEDRQELGLKSGDRVIETLRIRTADGEPVVLERNHFSMAFSYLEDADLGGSLYRLLKDYGIEPKDGYHAISICFAGEEEAKLLGVAKGYPLMKLHEVIFDQKGRPLHNSEQLIRGDRYTFRI